MSNLKAEALLREFYYNGIRIPDPGPELTVEQVRDLLTPNYPEIATARWPVPKLRARCCAIPSAGRLARKVERWNRK
jgi:PRTRC genetic system protein C